ncbi:ABC transporter substrate-binding protein [Flocculibacter collagenilyticus]|uniref:ABC transporter substrate-binding protein n=1 Tax=Flocculibacter collagenilyticus TaxID=2744479 RepID=UPI0018F5A01A|nr:ABC transporter substrate-binding protein [Flocculibacter collagenilyticus]
MNTCFKKVVGVAALIFSSVFVHAETVKVGMTTALTGPAAALGEGMKTGITAYFDKVNKAGGVNGHQLQLIALDDGYEPDKAAQNMRKLIDEEKVIAVAGNVGTPTAIVTVPIANEKKTLLFGAFTGAGVLRNTPPDRYVINYRPSYAQETATMIDLLLAKGIKPEEIAFFTQNDGYGDAGYKGAMKALKAKGFSQAEQLAHGRYTRNTENVEAGLTTILEADVPPKAIIMVGAYRPISKFIKESKDFFEEEVHYLNVSFVGSVALLNALGSDAEGVIVTQAVPHYESNLPIIKEYQAAVPADKQGFVSLEGYIVGKILVEGLKKSSSIKDREALIDGMHKLTNLDIGLGVPVSFSSSRHQAIDKVWPTEIKNGKYVEIK